MLKIHSKVVKLIKALQQHGQVYIVSKRQFYSAKLGKVLSMMELRRVMTVKEYREKINPKYRGKKEFIDFEIMSDFSEVEILKKLATIYAEVREHGKGTK